MSYEGPDPGRRRPSFAHPARDRLQLCSSPAAMPGILAEPGRLLGTITEILATRNGFVSRARMRIDHAYKGVSAENITLFDDGMCNGPNLKLGDQYLMYTRVSDDSNADVPSRGCTRSRSVKYAAEDLEFLKNLPSAAPTGTIQGQALGRTDQDFGDDQPL